jgi:hypothetical protein
MIHGLRDSVDYSNDGPIRGKCQFGKNNEHTCTERPSQNWTLIGVFSVKRVSLNVRIILWHAKHLNRQVQAT